MEPKVMRYRTDDGALNILAYKLGNKFLHAVTVDSPVRCLAIPKAEMRFMMPLLRKGSAYPPARAARRMLRAAKALGCTKSARKALDAIRKEA